ncbi:MAG: hypothetical protein AAGA48_07175 [Myxococcota bacterium]
MRTTVILAALLPPCNPILLVAGTEVDPVVAPVIDESRCEPHGFADPDLSTIPRCTEGQVARLGDQSFDSIQQAVDASTDGDVIVICEGRHTESITITRRRIALVADSDATILDGAAQGRPLDLIDSTVTLQGLTFADGRAEQGGAIRSQGSHLLVQAATFISNTAVQNGGAIASGHGTLFLENVQFEGNEALRGNGGALDVFDTCVEVRGSTFVENRSDYAGGAIGWTSRSTNRSLTLWDSTFAINTSGYEGGAISFGNVGEDSVSILATWNSTFEGNRAGYNGGAIQAGGWGSTRAFVTESTFRTNITGYEGGAIATGSHGMTTLEVVGGRFTDNVAEYAGGAIGHNSWTSDHVRISDATFIANVATNQGGSVNVDSYEAVTVALTGGQFEASEGATEVPLISVSEGFLMGVGVDFPTPGVHLESTCGALELGPNSSFGCEFGTWVEAP